MEYGLFAQRTGRRHVMPPPPPPPVIVAEPPKADMTDMSTT
jgi:hypothetical protein